MWSWLHSDQTHDACAIPAIILQKKIPTNVESFTLTAKLTAVSENVSFLRRECVENEVTDIHKFYRREVRFIRKFSASFSYCNERCVGRRPQQIQLSNNRLLLHSAAPL